MTSTSIESVPGTDYWIGLALGLSVCLKTKFNQDNELFILGDVYRGIDIYSRKEVAVKIEYTVDTDSFDVGTCGPYRSQLEHEYHVYKALAGCLSIPQVLWFGTECDYDVIVSDLLGPSLQDIFTQVYRHKFGLRNVLLLADKMVCHLLTHFILLSHYHSSHNWNASTPTISFTVILSQTTFFLA